MRGPLLLLTWIAATVAATGLAWAGVRSVVDGVAAPLPAPAVTDAATQAPDERSGPPSGGTEAATPRPEPSTPAEDQTTVRTFQLTGGTATIRFSPTRVEVVSAVPAPWFTTDVDPAGDTTRVEFESDRHRSRLDAWWDGRPSYEVEEQDQGEHDDDDRDDRGGDDDRGGEDSDDG